MFEKILYCVGNKTIEINGEDFSLGELTTEVLNLPRNNYLEMKTILDSAIQKTYKYETSHDLKDWFEANEDFILLDKIMSKYKIFSLLKEDNNILKEVRQFTSQLSVFENDDCELSQRDLEILSQIEEYNEYLEHPENFGNSDTVYLDDEKSGLRFPIDIPKPDIPSAPPSKTRALLIYPGNIKAKWEYYKNFCSMYERILSDIQSFNNTIYNFIDFYLSKIQKLNSNNYTSALHNFLNHPSAIKLIANPITDTGLFTNADSVTLRYIPRETLKGSGEFKIYEYYEVQSLQTLLKTDFYKALEAGYIIRRCEYCGRFFLLNKAYHTKYCDKPAPDNPNYTCAQLGYHYKGVKETVADNPKAQSLNRCYKRIDKDLSRRIITAEEREILYAKAKDLYHHAKITPGISNEEFEKSLASGNLYPLCNVIRKTNPRGRPKAKR